jgi:16S rRNA (cytidine1402-2'-O)-methyltransferase
MSGTLYLVATPIGNLEDVTMRAIRVLGEVQLIAAEDTRRTATLLRHYGIATKTTSLHEHNERQKAPGLVSRLQAGDSIALLSDAGTPLMSDPGLLLVRQSLDAGISVVPLPGPSAIIAALVCCGAPVNSFTFVGFPPRRPNDRKKWCEALAGEPRTLVFFESPHRLATTLKLMRACWGDRTVALCRELTKIHEELVVRPISELIETLGSPRGEFTCVVWPPSQDNRQAEKAPEGAILLDELGKMTNAVAGRRSAVKELGRKYGLTARQMYSAVEEAKKIGQKT